MRPAILCCAALVVACLLGFPAHAQSATTDERGDPVVAIVNGEQVHRSDVLLYHQTLPQQYRQLPIEMLYPQLLEGLVQRKYVAQAARAIGLHDDGAVRKRLAWIEESLLQEAYLDRQVDEVLNEERLHDAYDRMIAAREREEEVHASHILVEAEDEAKEVIAALARGADFAETAKERSIGPTASSGGDLGYFTKGNMVPEFAEAAFAMRRGEISKAPVQTQFGWHVIMIEDRREAAPPSYEESVDSLREQETQVVVGELLERLESGAEVQRFTIDGTELIAPAEQGE